MASPSAPARTSHSLADLPLVVASGCALALVALFLCVVPLASNLAASRDFVVYWATGRQLIHHASPFDPLAMMRIERSAGLDPGYGVLFMRNPPWGLPLAWPLGLFGVRLAAFLWSLVLAGCVGLSVLLLWRIQGRPANHLHWLGLSFAPALLCLFVGQTSIFSLLGYVLFLRLHARRPFWAGVSLWLCALKPHLFLPLGVVLALWIIVSRAWRLLAGAAAALAVSSAITCVLAPTAWPDYLHIMRATGIEREFIPCLSVALRQWINPQLTALQTAPVILGCLWALAYYWPRRRAWDWGRDGSLPLLVSLFLAPYCWLYDQVLAIPALLGAAYRTRSRALPAVLACASLLIEAQLIGGIKIPSPLYLWAAPAWLVWYLLAVRAPSPAAPGAPAASGA